MSALAGAALGCRGVLGIDPLPPEVDGGHEASADAGRPYDGGTDVADVRALARMFGGLR